ncbi:pyridoxal phosphate-dependent transferase [Pyronema omphalodes]|nr:pyridoxal phosphate-dependent transferase [Pyronema omphalodes]
MTSTTEPLDLLRGHPSTRLLPTAEVNRAVTEILTNPLPQDSYSEIRHPLHYGPDNGNLNVREEIGKWTAEKYMLDEAIPPENLYITNGASYGLSTALSLFTSPQSGYTKRAFIISPTYFLASRAFEDAGFADKLTAIKSTKNSIDFDALEKALENIDRYVPDVPLETALQSSLRIGAKKEDKRLYKYVLYATPTFSNPTGETWDLSTRQQILTIARKWDILLITDDVYDFLGNQTSPQPALLPRLVSLDAATISPGDTTGNTISNCSFSKLLGPGLRCGWIETATPVLATQLGNAGAPHSGGCPSQFTSMIIYSFLVKSPGKEKRGIDMVVERITGTYTKRCDALRRAVGEYLPEGTQLDGAKGGFFAWLRLPEGVDAAEVVKLAAEEGVVVASGGMSECPGKENSMGWGKRCIRISISYCEEEQIVEGIRRLGVAVGRWKEGERSKGESRVAVK